MIRFKDTQKLLQLSVHDVIDSGPPSGDLQLQVAWTVQTRMKIGQQLHTEYQERELSQNEHFEKEVSIQHLMVVDGWEVEISGRIDGVIRENGHVLVEEIKSSTLPRHLLQQKKLEDMWHWRQQVELYVYFLNAQGQKATGDLVVISVVDNYEHRLAVPPSETIEGFIITQVRWLIQERQKQIAWYAERWNAVQNGLPFVHDEWRNGQEEMTQTLEKHLENDRLLLLRAPTGYGKTAASLYAALQVAYRSHRKIFFATARNTQQAMVEKTVRNLLKKGVPIHAVSLRSKEKSCLNDKISCRPETCVFAAGYYDKLQQNRVLSDIWKDGLLHGDLLGILGQTHCVCPYQVSMDVLSSADVVIGDYNYLFDPNVALGAVTQHLKDWIVIVDEAHNLPTRAQDYGSPFLSIQKLWQAIDLVQHDHQFAKFAEPLQKVFDVLIHGMDKLKEEGLFEKGEPLDQVITRKDVEDWAQEIQDLGLEYAVKRLEYPISGGEGEDPWMECAWSILKFQTALKWAGNETVVLWQKNGPDRYRSFQVDLFQSKNPAKSPYTGMGLLCRDPAVILSPFFEKVGGAICMSATLLPFDFYGQMLGLPETRLMQLEYDSPFPLENRAAYALPFISTKYRDRDRANPKIAALLVKIMEKITGNIAIFFSSFAVLEAVYAMIEKMDIDRPFLIQSSKMKEVARQKILRTMVKGEGHVLFAVMGGIFSEGVDLPGKSLEAAIMVGPSLPMFNLSRQLMQEWYEEKYGDGFRYAWVIPGMARVAQAAGRVIRTETDRGVVILIGNRFAEPLYKDLFPSEWHLQTTSTLGADLERFFDYNR